MKKSGRGLTSVPPDVFNMTSLEMLDLSNNELTGLPNELSNLSSLLRLDLRGNAVSVQDLEGIRAKLIGVEILVDE